MAVRSVVEDEILYAVAEAIKSFCIIYLVDVKEVPDFNTMYELYDPVTASSKHTHGESWSPNHEYRRSCGLWLFWGVTACGVLCVVEQNFTSTGNNNKVNWAMNDKQERASSQSISPSSIHSKWSVAMAS
eukprot:3033662-Amphidinium_carterae.1